MSDQQSLLAAVRAAAGGSNEDGGMPRQAAPTVAEVAAAFPDVVAAIRADAVKAEANRQAGIDKLAASMKGHETLVAGMKADPTVSVEAAAVRLIEAEGTLRARQLERVKEAGSVAKDVAAAPTATGHAEPQPAGRPGETAANDRAIAEQARAYQAEQAELGNAITAAAAVDHIRRQSQARAA